MARGALRSLMMAALLAVGAAPALAQEKLTVKFDFLPYGSHAPFWLAQDKGWFKEAGVEPAFEDGQGSTVAVQLISAGKLDVGYISLGAVIVARDKGVPVKSIAGVLRKNDYGVLVGEETNI